MQNANIKMQNDNVKLKNEYFLKHQITSTKFQTNSKLQILNSKLFNALHFGY